MVPACRLDAILERRWSLEGHVCAFVYVYVLSSGTRAERWRSRTRYAIYIAVVGVRTDSHHAKNTAIFTITR